MTYSDKILTLLDEIPGARVFPTANKIPVAPGSWKDYATADPTKIQNLWDACEFEVAMVVPHNMVVIDVDVKNNAPGLDTLRDLASDSTFARFIANTRCHRTKSGGFHFFGFSRAGAPIKNKTGFLPGIDLRSQGLGYVVAPPSEGYSVWTDKHILELPEVFYEWYEHSEEREDEVGLVERNGEGVPSIKSRAYLRDGDGRNARLASYLGRIRHFNANFDEGILMSIARKWNEDNCLDLLDDVELGRTAKSIMKYPSALTGDNALISLNSLNSHLGGATEKFQWEDSTPWPTLHPDAFYGVVGDYVRELAPHTEADPAALLFQTLTATMNMVGFGPRIQVGETVHHARLYVVIVGKTAKARKGQSYNDAMAVLKAVDGDLVNKSRLAGLASGEALVAVLSDEYDKDGYLTKAVEKRVVIHETEFARLLTNAERQGSNLSSTIRDAWDGGSLRNLRSREDVRVDDAFVSLIGHITLAELEKKLDNVEVRNGFANRMMFVAAKRQQLLPVGGRMPRDRWFVFVERFKIAIARARQVGEMKMSGECFARWAALYCSVFNKDEAGLAGDLLARGEPQTLRMMVAFAALDGVDIIEVKHLNAAYALWRYVEDSTRHIFGQRLGDDVQQRLLQELRDIYPTGLDGTQQNGLFKGHVSGGRLLKAREYLIERGLAREESIETGGRARCVLYAVPKKRGLLSLVNSLKSHLWDVKTNSLQVKVLCDNLERAPLDGDDEPELTSPTCELSELSELRSSIKKSADDGDELMDEEAAEFYAILERARSDGLKFQ